MPGFARRAIPAPDPRKAPSWRPRFARATLGLDELSELLEFQPRPARGHPRDEPSAIAVEKAKMQQVILKPAPGRRQPHGRSPVPLTLGEQLLCHDRCVALDFRFVLRKRADRVVQQVSTQTACLSLETDRKSTRLNSSHDQISYAVFCLKKKNTPHTRAQSEPVQ